MNSATTCLVLVRDPERSRGAERAERADILFRRIVEPIAIEFGLTCVRVDPTEYGIQDQRLFTLLESAAVVVVDASADSMDYAYSLGVRHALSDKPTFIFAEMERIAFDVSFPHGMLPMRMGIPDFSAQAAASDWLRTSMQHALVARGARFSPVRAALEEIPRVFLSYCHADRESVAAVDQWLREHGTRVDLDERDFIAGRDVRDEIMRCVHRAGKVVCFFSDASKDRYYTKLERRLAEEVEYEAHAEGKTKVVLLYFRLDATPLPKESAHRLAINAWKMGFSEACDDLRRHLLEKPAEPAQIPLSRYDRQPPWRKATEPKSPTAG